LRISRSETSKASLVRSWALTPELPRPSRSTSRCLVW
jgi:hypothetical protein